MENSEYLKNRIVSDFSAYIIGYQYSSDVDINEFNKIISENKEKILSKRKDATDFNISFIPNEDEGTTDVYLHYKSVETEEEYNKRIKEKERIKERAVKSLEILIKANPQDALRIIKELDIK